MKKTTLLLLTALALTACSRQENTAPNAAASAVAATMCVAPNLNQQVRDAIQSIMATEAQHFTQADSRQWVDADKLIAASAQLNITLSEPQGDGQACQAAVKIALPSHLREQTAHNAPLLESPPLADILQQAFNGSNIQFDGQSIDFHLNYRQQNGQLTASDNDLARVAAALSRALLPYGVKDILIINNQTISREEALRLLTQPSKLPQTQAETASAATQKAREVPPISEEIAPPPPRDLTTPQVENEAPETASSAKSAAPETLTPPTATMPSVSENELAQAKQAHDNADQSIKQAWRKITPDIQSELMEEQRTWERKKQSTCRDVASKGSDAAHSQYLQIQCDTRMTRERVQYLNGFSIE